jgi:hypothetical protein
MVISSRMPEGSPNRCPICNSTVYIESSKPFGDAPCPNCGTLLWFLQSPAQTRFLTGDEAGTIRELLKDVNSHDEERASFAADQLLAVLTRLGADSLDIVELIMESEEDRG